MLSFRKHLLLVACDNTPSLLSFMYVSFHLEHHYAVQFAKSRLSVSAQNCVGQLQNLPVCANSTWNMYELITFGSTNYFCCEQGQVGVIPTAGYAGICQAQGQAVPSSLLATLVRNFPCPICWGHALIYNIRSTRSELPLRQDPVILRQELEPPV